MSGPCTGPTVREMIASGTLAKEIMNRHGSSQTIFDDAIIAELHRFVLDPAAAHAALYKKTDPDDSESQAMVKKPGGGRCSLLTYTTAVHGTDTMLCLCGGGLPTVEAKPRAIE